MTLKQMVDSNRKEKTITMQLRVAPELKSRYIKLAQDLETTQTALFEACLELGEEKFRKDTNV